jgi:hypothetical protein
MDYCTSSVAGCKNRTCVEDKPKDLSGEACCELLRARMSDDQQAAPLQLVDVLGGGASPISE